MTKELNTNQQYTGKPCPKCGKRLIENVMSQAVWCESCDHTVTHGQLNGLMKTIDKASKHNER